MISEGLIPTQNCKFGTPPETALELIKKAESAYYERKEEQRRRDQAAEETRRQQQAEWDSKGIYLISLRSYLKDCA